MTSETTTIPGLSPSKKERDATVEAVNHLIQGKRHLLVQDISSAVNSLQEACRILAACYGELANECADAYYHYGVSLLEMSRKESGILGNEKEGSSCDDSEEDDDDDDEEEEENDEESGDEKTTEENEQATDEVTPEKENEGGSNKAIREEVENDKAGEKVAEEGDKTDKGDPNTSIMKEDETIAKDSEAKSEDLDDSRKADEEVVSENRPQPKSSNKTNADDNGCSSTAADVTCEPSTSKEGSQAKLDSSLPGTSQDKGAGEDDVTTLQLSWEVLDLAKVIYKRQSADNREMQLRLAQVYLKLGEVAMESESYKQSIEDMIESCKILQEVLPSDDRAIAEVYYQLGLAYTFDLQYDVAIENFRGAIKVLKDRIANLEKVIAEKGDDKSEDVVYNAKREVEEILELVPEILEKITDTEDLQKNSLKLPEELNKGLVPEKCQGEINVPENSPVKEQKPVSSIAHLVRKKRKPEDVILNKSESTETKRCRSEGDGDSEDTNSVPCINGTVETSTPPTIA